MEEGVGRWGQGLATCRKQKRTWAVNLSKGGFFPCDFNGLTFVLGWGAALHSSVRVSGCCDWVAPCGGPEVILSGALIWSESIVPPWSSHGLQRHVVRPDSAECWRVWVHTGKTLLTSSPCKHHNHAFSIAIDDSHDIFKLEWHPVEHIHPPRSNSPLSFIQASNQYQMKHIQTQISIWIHIKSKIHALFSGKFMKMSKNALLQ